jgi:hypothetical protein
LGRINKLAKVESLEWCLGHSKPQKLLMSSVTVGHAAFNEYVQMMAETHQPCCCDADLHKERQVNRKLSKQVIMRERERENLESSLKSKCLLVQQ